MATLKQQKAIEELVGNGGNVTKAMIEAGYTPATAHTPGKLTDSKGFNELLEEYGLTNKLIVTSLVDDIKSKPTMRVKELSLGAEILGLKKKDTDLPASVVQNFTQIVIHPPNDTGDQPNI